MNTVEQRQQELILEFSKIQDWEDRYKKIISMGKELPRMDESMYEDKFLVKGCQSRVWLHANLSDSGCVALQADSDAMIVKGLVSLLLRVYSGVSPEEILSTPPHFIEEIGFKSYLSQSRANGFLSMVKQIMLYATAFKMTQGSVPQ